MTLRAMSLVPLAGVFLAACTAPSMVEGDPPPPALGRVSQVTSALGGPAYKDPACPSTDFRDVNRYDGSFGPSPAFVQAIKGPVARLDSGCSAVLIAPDIMLSHSICFNHASRAFFDYELRADGTYAARDEYRFTVLEHQTKPGLEYGIIQLDGDASSHGIARLNTVGLAAGDPVTLLDHNFRAGGPYPADPFGTLPGMEAPKSISAGTFLGLTAEGWLTHSAPVAYYGVGAVLFGPEGTVVGVNVAAINQKIPPATTFCAALATSTEAIVQASPLVQSIVAAYPPVDPPVDP